MNKLKVMQNLMMDYLEKGRENAIVDLINPNPELQSSPLQIYRESIYGNHRSAFAQIYPVIEQLVGQEFFDYTLTEYLKNNPNQNYDISLYGSDFAYFLEGFEPCRSLSYLPDVARLEWMCNEACLGKSYTLLDFEALAKLDEQQHLKLCFLLPPSSSVIDSKYPILKIWKVNQADHQGSQEIHLDGEGDKVFVWRKALDLRVDSLSNTEYFCLSAFQKNLNLEKIFYILRNEYDVSEIGCQEILLKMIQRGWLVGFNVLE